jgi:hypothetical protein
VNWNHVAQGKPTVFCERGNEILDSIEYAKFHLHRKDSIPSNKYSNPQTEQLEEISLGQFISSSAIKQVRAAI